MFHYMKIELVDEISQSTKVGTLVKWVCGITTVISVVALFPASLLAFLMPVGCEGPCSQEKVNAASLLMFTPVFLFISMGAGIVNVGRPRWSLFLLAEVPLAIVVALFSVF